MMIMICFVPFLATEEGPFRAKTFCQVKLSTTCLTLKNQQIPIELAAPVYCSYDMYVVWNAVCQSCSWLLRDR